MLFLSLSLLTFRYILFSVYVKHQKSEFRKLAISEYQTTTKQVLLQPHELYKSNSKIEWKDNNKEVLIDGTYYEVLKVEKSANAFKITLLEDHLESKLFSNFFCNINQKGNLAAYFTLILNLNFEIPHSKIATFLTESSVNYTPIQWPEEISAFLDEDVIPPRLQS